MITLHFVFYIFSIISFTPYAYAADSKFSLAYDLSYKVHDDGTTTVTENIHLTNLTTQFFATEYVMKLNNAQVFNLKAYDRSGALSVTTDPATGSASTNVHIKFRDEVVGKDNTLHWTLVFDTPEVAKKIGRLWEINIPAPDSKIATTSYTVGLYIPTGFGTPVFQKPSPTAGVNIWSKEDIGHSGINVVYLPAPASELYQTYNFQLRYYLYNTQLLPAQMEIALPPDTNYQKVLLNNITPKPLNIRLDKDGNWLAEYNLAPGKDVTILAVGQIAVFHQPTLAPQPAVIPSDYLQSSKYWTTADPKIVSLAQELRTPRIIFNYVVSNLAYDQSRIRPNTERLGAIGALNQPNKAICMEFTDLFIALSRAAGIPAREIDGYGATTDPVRQPSSLKKDVLHAWPEYFDLATDTWHMVDPTWENTTLGSDYFYSLDFNHIAFVIRGENDSYPYPAGSYKKFSTSKDVLITPADQTIDLTSPPKISLSLDTPTLVHAPFPTGQTIKINNLGPTLSPKQKITLTNSTIPLGQTSWTVSAIPPHGHTSFPLSLTAVPLTYEGNVIITVKVGDQDQSVSFRIEPIYKSPPLLMIGGLIILVILSIFTQRTRSLFFQKQ